MRGVPVLRTLAALGTLSGLLYAATVVPLGSVPGGGAMARYLAVFPALFGAYLVAAFPVEHRVTAYGYAFVEDDRPGRFDAVAARALGVREGPDFGRLQRGATHALLGRGAKVTELRGRVMEVAELEVPVLVTLHPSAVLRAGDRRDERRAELTHDLSLVRTTLEAKGVATAARG